MSQEPRYEVSKEFIRGSEVDYWRGFVYEQFGYNHNGYSVYNPLVLAIVTNDTLAVAEKFDDQDNPGYIKSVDKTIDGTKYWTSYVAGFKIGYNEFNERKPVVYGPGSTEFIKDLMQLYKYGDDHNLSWLKEARLLDPRVNDYTFKNYGIFAGLCFGVEKLAHNYPILRDVVYERIGDPQQGFGDIIEEQINQEFDLSEKRQVICDILKPLSGLSPTKQKIMSSDDFSRLIMYTEYLILNDALPEEISVIEQTNISTDHIRFTFFRLHKKLFTTKKRKYIFYDFLQAVFRQFKTQDTSTIHKKFHKPPGSYFRDFNISL